MVLLLVGLLLGACGGDSRVVEWRDLSVVLPEGWSTFEQTNTVLGIANAPLDDEGIRGERAVAAQFTHEPRTIPQDWRDLVAASGGTLEVDEAVEVDGVPGTRLVFLWDTGGIPTREMVVVLPARGIVILLQPVVEMGETDGPQRFLENRAAFDALLATIDFGAPLPG